MKRLVTSGCSFTYGKGLDDPSRESWPSRLAEMSTLDCVNLGENGMGNEYCLSSIINYFSLHPNHINDSVVVICFSSYSRIEFFNSQRQEVFTSRPLLNTDLDFINKFRQEYFNEEYYFERYLRTIILLQTYLKFNKIPYIMFEAFDHVDFKRLLKGNRICALFKQIDKSNWIKFGSSNFKKMTAHMEFQDDGHPAASAHNLMAEILYEPLCKLTIEQ